MGIVLVLSSGGTNWSSVRFISLYIVPVIGLARNELVMDTIVWFFRFSPKISFSLSEMFNFLYIVPVISLARNELATDTIVDFSDFSLSFLSLSLSLSLRNFQLFIYLVSVIDLARNKPIMDTICLIFSLCKFLIILYILCPWLIWRETSQSWIQSVQILTLVYFIYLLLVLIAF